MEEPTVVDHKTLKALAADTRMGIIKELSQGSLTPSDLGKRLNKSNATIVEHLDKLRDSGLVSKEETPGKKWVFYSLTSKGSDIISNKSNRFVIIVAVSIIAIVLGSGVFGIQFLQTSRTFAPMSAPTLGKSENAPSTSMNNAGNKDNFLYTIVPSILIIIGILGLFVALKNKFRLAYSR